jgi:thiamine-phosphate pyrophosphorylase
VTPTATLPRLHVLTDPAADDRALAVVEAALGSGARCVQVRAKGLDDRHHLGFAREVVARCRRVGALCLVNDRVDLALASGADGVHLGATDLPVAAARELAGDRLLIGGTARDPATAAELVAEGADYLGAGPLFVTSTKDGLPAPIGFDRLAAIVRAVDVPVVGISGITADRVPAVLAAGAHGVAVTAAITSAPDPAAATAALLAALPEGPATSPTTAARP